MNAPRVFYRIVRSDTPTDDDFRSFAALGRPRPPSVQPPRLWEGISVYDTEERAGRMAQNRPRIGAYIARLDIPPDAQIEAARTRPTPGHHTLWADPKSLRACVTEIRPV
jgi:hypothetical protein